MPVELRKRKAPVAEPVAAPAKKKGTVAKTVAKVKEAIAPKVTSTTTEPKQPTPSASGSIVTVGKVVNLDGFGGEIETNDGVKTTLKKLVEESKSGVVLFTYPKASTPGCTTQACLFRDSYTPLTATGFSIFGLSRDSPKSNTTFKTKQQLPYPLLSDAGGKLILSIGLKKSPAGTQRGVFVIDKAGKVLAAQPGSPSGTVDVVKKLVEGGAGTEFANGTSKEDAKVAETAAEVADTAEKIDSTEEKAQL